MLDNLIQAHLGFILAATLMCVPNTLCSQSVHVDTSTNQAVRKNSECQKVRDTYGEMDIGFIDCNKVLQKLIKQLFEMGKIDPNRCQVDVTEKVRIQIGYCYVTVSIGNKHNIRHLTISDPHLIHSIIEGGYIPEDKTPLKNTNHALTQREKDSSLTSSSNKDKKKTKAEKKAKKEDKKKLTQWEEDSSSSSSSSDEDKKQKEAEKKAAKKAAKTAAKKAKEEEKHKLKGFKPLKTDDGKKAMKDDSSDIQGPSNMLHSQKVTQVKEETEETEETIYNKYPVKGCC